MIEATVLVAPKLNNAKVDELRKAFREIHYYPGGVGIPDGLWADIDIFYASAGHLPVDLTVDQVPKLRLIQLSSAGANAVLKKALFKDKKAREQIRLCSASGIHAKYIPQYLVCQAVNIMTAHHLTQHMARVNQHWAKPEEYTHFLDKSPACQPTGAFVYGKTVGMLGYGRIARETARLFKAMNAKVIAANSTGKRTTDEGYILPGTGDPDGSIPEEIFSTREPEQVKAFLGRSEILVCTMPSTPHTSGFLSKERLEMLPDGAVILNIGRGDLLKAEDLIKVLDSPRGLAGAVLDVTDPEPLPGDSPLYVHPRVIITPHSSGEFAHYFEIAADVLITNAKIMYEQKTEPHNIVDFEKGY